MRPFRHFEPFYLEFEEAGEHGRWLWGGGLHVFTHQHRELNLDVLVEWFTQLLPQTWGRQLPPHPHRG